jgi:hypothetical protein
MIKMAQVKNIKNFPVTIELGGKTRAIRFDLNAFAELELRFGSVQEAMKALESGSMKSVRTILWSGLIHEEAVIDEVTGEPIKYNITPYQVGGWVEPSRMQEISEKISLAVQSGIPDATPVAPQEIKVDNGLAKIVLTPAEQIEKDEQEKNA